MHEPKTLRFFTGRLEAVSDWPEKLMAAFEADFGTDQYIKPYFLVYTIEDRRRYLLRRCCLYVISDFL